VRPPARPPARPPPSAAQPAPADACAARATARTLLPAVRTAHSARGGHGRRSGAPRRRPPARPTLRARAAEDGGPGSVQFAAIPGPAYVSGFRSGHGVPELNTPQFSSPAGAVPNIGPIPGARLGALGRLGGGRALCAGMPRACAGHHAVPRRPAALHTVCDALQLGRSCPLLHARSRRMRAGMRCVRSRRSCEGLRALQSARASRAGAGTMHPHVTVQSVAAASHRPHCHALRRLARCGTDSAHMGGRRARAGAGAQGTSTIPGAPSIPATAIGTDATGAAFSTPTIFVDNYQQCGGTTGARPAPTLPLTLCAGWRAWEHSSDRWVHAAARSSRVDRMAMHL